MRQIVRGLTTDERNLQAARVAEKKTGPERTSFLFITDDPTLSRRLEPRLERLGLEPCWASSFHDALDQRQAAWRAVVLDLLVPRAERYAICREVRASFGLPVIVADERLDDAHGAKLGADFYLDKPVSAESIWASLYAIKSMRCSPKEVRHRGEIILFSESNAAFADGRLLDLSKEEFVILEQLDKANGNIVTMSELIDALSGSGQEPDPNLVDALVARLMIKLTTRSSQRVIRSPKRDGYMLQVS